LAAIAGLAITATHNAATASQDLAGFCGALGSASESARDFIQFSPINTGP
jgi:hypothetical protein